MALSNKMQFALPYRNNIFVAIDIECQQGAPIALSVVLDKSASLFREKHHQHMFSFDINFLLYTGKLFRHYEVSWLANYSMKPLPHTNILITPSMIRSSGYTIYLWRHDYSIRYIWNEIFLLHILHGENIRRTNLSRKREKRNKMGKMGFMGSGIPTMCVAAKILQPSRNIYVKV